MKLKHLCCAAALAACANLAFAEQLASAPTLPSDFAEWQTLAIVSCDLAKGKKIGFTQKVKEEGAGTTTLVQRLSLNGELYSHTEVLFFAGEAVLAESVLRDRRGNWTSYLSENPDDLEKARAAELAFLEATKAELDACIASAK